jgi:hypothetical protein
VGWHAEHREVLELRHQIAKSRQNEKRSDVVRSISRQMEEIADQQRIISDEQREEAIQQKRTADEMRQRSEVERQKALVAQKNAVASEQQAQDARRQAEAERQMAEHQRIQAEFSKRVADTLSYVALGRSLASLSVTQSQLGNSQLAELLAYASYHFTNRYKGDVYYPAVFQSLMLSSQSKRSWPRHNGSVMGLAYISDSDNRIITVSSYGEIMVHNKRGDQLDSKVLFSDKNFDFRDIYIDQDATSYAVCREGHLVIIEKGVATVKNVLTLPHPLAITALDDDNLLIIGEQGLALYNKQQRMIKETRELNFRITAFNRYNYEPVLFDNKGRQHIVKSIHELETTPIPVKGHVTAFASSKSTKMRAYGMIDGTIYLYNELNKNVIKLDGHLSRISKLKINGHRLFSASYDGNLNVWNTASQKIEPTTLISAGSWILNFNFDNTKEFAWMGDQQGNVTEALMSIPKMVDIIHSKLKRDFTQDEWNYYIGNKVPYESFLSPERKEGGQ